MTLRSLINFGQSLTQVAGVNIKMLDPYGYDISYCILKHEKGVVSLVKFETGILTLIELEEKLRGNLSQHGQLHINLEGKGILTKTIERPNNITDQKEIVKKLFPMLKVEEFTIQESRVGEQFYFDAIRNDVIENFMSLASYFSVVSLSLGPFVIAPLASILKSDVLQLAGYIITFAEQKISKVIEVSSNDRLDNITVGEDSVPASALLAYASALRVFVRSSQSNISDLSWIQDSSRKFLFNKTLYQAAKIALVTVLSVLMLNAFVSFWLQSETQSLELQASSQSGRKNEHDSKQKKLSGLSTAYDGMGWESNQIPIYYADQIAQKVTPEIQLTLLDIGVVDEKILKKEKKQIYQASVIKVKGFAKSPVSLESWVGKLENLAWVKDIFDQKYQYDNKQGKGLFEFYIQIK